MVLTFDLVDCSGGGDSSNLTLEVFFYAILFCSALGRDRCKSESMEFYYAPMLRFFTDLTHVPSFYVTM